MMANSESLFLETKVILRGAFQAFNPEYNSVKRLKGSIC